MASAQKSVGTSTAKRSKMPSEIMELIDLAIFQFSTLSGLRLKNKVRGDPVLEGVCAVLAQLLACAQPRTRKLLDEFSSRFGGWKPGAEATKELKDLLSQRIRRKKDEILRENGGPYIPNALVYNDTEFDERTERVVVKGRYPQCWRCKEKCLFCAEVGEKSFLKEGFKIE